MLFGHFVYAMICIGINLTFVWGCFCVLVCALMIPSVVWTRMNMLVCNFELFLLYGFLCR